MKHSFFTGARRLSALALCLCLILIPAVTVAAESESPGYIRWVDFSVTQKALSDTARLDIEAHESGAAVSWIDLLSLLAAKNGGNFGSYKTKDAEALAQKLREGKSPEELCKNQKLFAYYRQAYSAILGGMLGPGTRVETDENGHETRTAFYGLRAFSPLAQGYSYTHYDDFGASRSYGYRRSHLGHDLMGSVGTPVIAVESGYIEACGWNQYGGWRIGIRSFDGKRYYYYAHLRKDYPYQSNLKEGSLVTAGDVIGYLGHTGYSSTENTNNIAEPHLHFGLQLIFDESQKEGNNEIWIDCYELIRFLAINRSETVKKDGTKEWTRVYEMKDSSLEQFSTNDKNSRKR